MIAAVLPSSTSITSALSDLSSHKVKNPWGHDFFCKAACGCEWKPEASICQAAIALDHIWGRGRALKTWEQVHMRAVFVFRWGPTDWKSQYERGVRVCFNTRLSALKHIIPCCHRSVKVPVCELLCACLTKRTLPTRKGTYLQLQQLDGLVCIWQQHRVFVQNLLLQ